MHRTYMYRPTNHRTLSSRPLNNENGARKVYMCNSVFPKCENHEFIERCFSVSKITVLYCKFTYLDIYFKDVYNTTVCCVCTIAQHYHPIELNHFTSRAMRQHPPETTCPILHYI